MDKQIPECYAQYVKDFLENNWQDFVDLLSENYDDDAEDIAEEIVKALS